VGLGVAAAVVAGAVTSATPANATAAGLTFYPSTDIYGAGNYHFDSDTFIGEIDGVDGDANITSIGLSGGFGKEDDSTFGRNEAGFDYFTNSGSSSLKSRLWFNAKTQLFNNEDTRVVAGAWGVGSKSALAPNVAYVVGSKNFEFGRVHLGVARSLQDKDIVGKDRTNLQLGYDKVFADGKFQFTLDYYTGDTSYSALAPGIIYYINDKAAVQLGYVKPNSEGAFGFNSQIYLAFDYNFGGSRTEGAPAPAPETSTSTPANQ
jgi:hypothetical protein